MIINKHGSFYMRNGWGTKIIQAIKINDMIFTPSNEQNAIDNIGLGRIMIKSLRYWSNVLGLTTEQKVKNGIKLIPTYLYNVIEKYDMYFQDNATLLLLHRNLARNQEEATAWYWFFNEYDLDNITKEEFTDKLKAYLFINGVNVKKDAVSKEFNCFKNTYIGTRKTEKNIIIDDDTYPFFAPLNILREVEKSKLEKRNLTRFDIPTEVLIYAIIEDNKEMVLNNNQISVDTILENKMQIGKYFNLKFSSLLEILVDADNKKYISLHNNFGNRYIEVNIDECENLLERYYIGKS